MVSKQKILIVDDDEHIAELISLYLTKECFDTRIEHDGQSAITAFKEYMPDVVLLDIMLPGKDGYQVCREIRMESNVPIIMLSAKTEVFDKVLGLELGADDYMIKPFDSKELVARVKALLRRANQTTSTTTGGAEVVKFPDLTVNLSNYEVVYKGETLEMAPKEIELLYFLASSPNQVFTREQLLDNIWGYDSNSDETTVRTHINRLRKKFADWNEFEIVTIRGLGYRGKLNE